MYFLVKDDRKANFYKFDAWKYPIFFSFFIFPFFEIFRRAFAPLPPYAPPLSTSQDEISFFEMKNIICMLRSDFLNKSH